MVKQIINDGVVPNDGQGDNLRAGAVKINSNFDEIYAALGNGISLTVVNNNLITATGENKITFKYNNLAGLPNATTYSGMFGFTSDTDKAYVAVDGTWTELLTTASSINSLSDVNTTSVPADGQTLIWNSATSNWIPGTVSGGGGGGAAATTFVALTDTPANYASANSKFVKVNSAATGLEFVAGIQSSDLSAISINSLSDVDTATTAPSVGQVLKWNGTNWVPAADATSGGAGTNADTLDGFDSTYYLNYNNLTNQPTIPTTFTELTDTPASFTSAGGRFVKVNAGATALEFTSVSIPATLDDLTDVVISAPTVGDVLYYNGTNWVKQNGPIIRWSLAASGSADYVYTGPGFYAATNDPTLYLHRGTTYIFSNTSHSNHPLEIRVSAGGAAYTNGVSGAGTDTVTFTVPMDAPSTLYYQCTVHSVMGNAINIVS
jgi:hypothetical protein